LTIVVLLLIISFSWSCAECLILTVIFIFIDYLFVDIVLHCMHVCYLFQVSLSLVDIVFSSERRMINCLLVVLLATMWPCCEGFTDHYVTILSSFSFTDHFVTIW